jgi:hypothetical protein
MAILLGEERFEDGMIGIDGVIEPTSGIATYGISDDLCTLQ